jgi:hypothetical protein
MLFDHEVASLTPIGSADKEVTSFCLVRRQHGLKTIGHRLFGPFALLMIGARASARFMGFGFPMAGVAPAFACWSRSRTIIRIHSGSAERPLRKSS